MGTIQTLKDLPINIDSTMISAFRSCPKKFHHEFALGLRAPVPSVDLHAGGCFATALEVLGKEFWVNKLPLQQAITRAELAFELAWGDFVPEKDTPKTRENMWKAVLDYVATYPLATDRVQPYFVDGLPTFEFTFAIPLDEATTGYPFPTHPSGDPFLYSGRFDLLGQYAGRPIIRDEKTSKALQSNWAEQWDLRSQFLGYLWAVRQMGLPINQVCVRGVIIQKTQIRQIEAIKIYPDMLIDRWLFQLYRDIVRMRDCWDSGYWDYNLADSCNSYSGCQFQLLCKSSDPESWYSNYEIKRWNPLDKQPQQAVDFTSAPKETHLADL